MYKEQSVKNNTFKLKRLNFNNVKNVAHYDDQVQNKSKL